MPKDKIPALMATINRKGGQDSAVCGYTSIVETNQAAHSAGPSIKRHKHAAADGLASRKSATVQSSDDVEILLLEDTPDQGLQGDTTCLDSTSQDVPKPQARGRAKAKIVPQIEKNTPFRTLTVTKPIRTKAEEVSVCSVRSPIVSTYQGWTTSEEAVKAALKTVPIAKTTLDKLAQFRHKPTGGEMDVVTTPATLPSMKHRPGRGLPPDQSKVPAEPQIQPICNSTGYDSIVAKPKSMIGHFGNPQSKKSQQLRLHIPNADDLLDHDVSETFFTQACWNPEDGDQLCRTTVSNLISLEVSDGLKTLLWTDRDSSVPSAKLGSVRNFVALPQNPSCGKGQESSDSDAFSGRSFTYQDVSGLDVPNPAVIKLGSRRMTSLTHISHADHNSQALYSKRSKDTQVVHGSEYLSLGQGRDLADLAVSEALYCENSVDSRLVPETNQHLNVQVPHLGTNTDKYVLDSLGWDEFNEGRDDSDPLDILSRRDDMLHNSSTSTTSKEADLRLYDISSTDLDDEYPMNDSDEEEMLKIANLNLDVAEKFQPLQSISYPFSDQSSRVYDSTLQFSPSISQASGTIPQYGAARSQSCHADHDIMHTSPTRYLGGSTSSEIGLDEWPFIDGAQSKPNWSDRITTSVDNCPFNQAESHVPLLPNMTVKELYHQAVHEVHADPNSVIESRTDPLYGNHEFKPLKRFTRPEFPNLIRDRSLVIGLSARIFLRTCFRIAEMYKEGKRCNSVGQDAIIELFARITYSSREPGTVKQHFRFADLFDDHPPYPQGVLLNYKTNNLADTESGMLLETKSGQVVRCLGRLKRDVKNDTGWLLHILTIRETDWEEIRYTKRIICADALKAEEVVF